MSNARSILSIIIVAALVVCSWSLFSLTSLELNLWTWTSVKLGVLVVCLWSLLIMPFLESITWRVVSLVVVLLGCLGYFLIAPSPVSKSLAFLVPHIWTILKVVIVLALVFGLRYFLFASLKAKISILQVASLVVLLGCLWYLLIAPSLKLDDAIRQMFHTQWKNLGNTQKKELREVAKFDLEKKVYPEIQDRLTKTNDWFINKMIFAGGLLGAFLFQLWWPFWSRDIPFQKRKQEAEAIFKNMLSSAPVCAVLGLACVVSLFMDVHARRSLIVTHQLGV